LLSKQDYITNLQIYHKKLESAVLQNYGVNTDYLKVLCWGYQTTAFYLKSNDNKEYLLRLANWSNAKEKAVIKDIDLSNRLRGVVPTPTYIKTLSDKYTCRFEDKLLRLSHYISGLAPLDMTFDILDQMVAVLKRIHTVGSGDGIPFVIASAAKQSEIATSRLGGTRDDGAASPPQDILLHGDLTPHNVLVSFGKIVAVMDFELSFVGPREWDLARTAFFSWNYMQNTTFEEVAQCVLEKYADNAIDSTLFYKYVVENAHRHLAAVESHKNDYEKPKDWSRDHAFISNQLKRLILFKM
jgi:Ser/Thr protein kinase RdoA (MazF antagonist)